MSRYVRKIEPMKRIYVSSLFVFTFVLCQAQDTLLHSQKWQTFFREYDRSALAAITSASLDKRYFLTGPVLYETLVIFKDSTKTSIEMGMPYPGFVNLCDPRQELVGSNRLGNQSYRINKKDVRYFIFDGMMFAYDDVIRKKYKFATPPNYWSMIVMDGPIRISRYVYPLQTTLIDGGRIDKGEDNIGSDVLTLGGLNFKKFGAKTFTDHPELAEKIATEQPGYSKKDVLKILREYNEWVAQDNPDEFTKYLLLAKYLN